ncbi:tRNA (adenosine(37)-N6)-threonylcarbamoyltransferase complex ATPase subunit type 1 TsaE [Thalassoglobus polymorphus]|nr:tRNA (adenosine(37)-N6)-threonylcarbamoyltransferase complex ATPase subunit type 1 TsaE [Thalassoglobus polymorphus]
MKNMDEMVVDLHSLEETQAFGKQLASVLRLGDVVALIGNLGAGKTHLAQAIAEGFGIDRDDVHSPTFVLIQEYEGSVPICHIDAYRLNDIDEFLELGADELLGADNICLIEWADRVADVLPGKRIQLEIESTGVTSRRIRLTCPQDRFSEFERKLRRS